MAVRAPSHLAFAPPARITRANRNPASQRTGARAPPLHYEALLLVPPAASPATIDRRCTGQHEQEIFEETFSGALASHQVKL